MTANAEQTGATEPGVEGERPTGRDEEGTNVGWPGRLSSVALGLALVRRGLGRGRSVRGGLTTALGGYLLYRGATGRCRAFDVAGVDTRRRRRPRLEPGASGDAQSVDRAITVLRSAEELHEQWTDPQQLSRIAGPRVAVTPAGEDRIRVTVDGPYGRTRSWQLELAQDEPGERVRWESTEAAIVPSEAIVTFEPAPGDRGTEVTLELRWDPPGGRLGAAVLERLGVVPTAFAVRALNRHKSLAETGEVATLEGNPSARGAGDLV